jgi:Protein of unknown function (DUF4233)
MSEAEPAIGRPRSVRRTLASIVLGFESIVMFLAALVMWGLGALPPALALGGGLAVCTALLATIALLRHSGGYAVAWILQVVILATSLFNTAMLFVGAVFVTLWIYCVVRGGQIDRSSRQTAT